MHDIRAAVVARVLLQLLRRFMGPRLGRSWHEHPERLRPAAAGYFARAMANRTWWRLFGRAIVSPVDDMHEGNAPSHPQLLELLTRRFIESGFDLKFFAQVRLCRAAWPLLKKSGGSIVAIAGIGGRAPVADYMIGSSVIGAQLAFMKALADLGKRDGVQVNSINPGSVDTDRFRHRLGIIMAGTGLNEAAATEHHRRELNITRFGQPEDIAGLVAFIVSPRGRWLQGAAIDMDGGQVEPLRMSKYD